MNTTPQTASTAGLLADGGNCATPEAFIRDPDTVAGIVSALRQVHGDGVTRLLLNDGLTLAHCNAISDSTHRGGEFHADFAA